MDEHLELGNKIRGAAHARDPVETELATNQRIIARVTDGIYREPWAAFRELVANAYDADATQVTIETGVPEFKHLVVRDDGIGMRPETLSYILQNIGGSSKRTSVGVTLNTTRDGSYDRSPGGRPLIGKIGIGLFAVAQLTQQFQIITKAADEKVRMSATVNLRTHSDSDFAEDDDRYVAGTVTILPEHVPEEERASHGTSVVLYSLRPKVLESLRSVQRWQACLNDLGDGRIIRDGPAYHIGVPLEANPEETTDLSPNYPWDPEDTPKNRFRRLFLAACASAGRGTKSPDLDQFDEYLGLIWKLSLSLPLGYLNTHPFSLNGATGVTFFGVPDSTGQATPIGLGEKETIRDNLNLRTDDDQVDSSFKVLLDGIELCRPIELPLVLGKRSRIKAPVMLVARQENPFVLQTQIDRAGGPLSFDAYLYWNSQIVPKDNIGVLIRVREASGTLFDPTFLNYQVSEQTRLRQITGEIFVHEGLDSAINIDRESFNYSHPHFLYIQNWLHRAIRLLMNRLKDLSAQDLERARDKRSHQRNVHALQIWAHRRGEDADPPIPGPTSNALTDEVGGVEIDWPPDMLEGIRDREERSERAEAVAIVLEAYDVLSGLPSLDRGQLVADILRILEIKIER